MKSKRLCAVSGSSRDHQTGGTHYTDMSIQPWDVIDAIYTREQRIGFYKGNALKYLMRCGSKDAEVQELKKCRDYINKLISEYE